MRLRFLLELLKKKTPKILERNKTNKNNKAIKGDHLKKP